MTEDEKKSNDVDKRVSNLETKFEMYMKSQDERFEAFVRSNEDFKAEMRQQNQMRAEEIRELRQKQDADIKEIRASIDNMGNRIDDMGRHVRNVSLTAMGAIGGMAVAIVAMVGTMIYSILSR